MSPGANSDSNIVFFVKDHWETTDQKKVNFRRSTLFSEIKNIQFNICIKLIKKFLNYYKKNKKTPKSFKQVGIPTYYKARSPMDSKLNINKSLRSQFNLLRIADNKKYPAFFNIFNNKYYLKIIKKQKIKYD